MTESDIESYLRDKIRAMGGKCWKFISPGTGGVPDRIVLLPNGRMFFVELKAPGKTLRPLQRKRKEELQALGFSVYVFDSKDEVDLLEVMLR
jgi:hypothetical protein